jgi:hypothetical protein
MNGWALGLGISGSVLGLASFVLSWFIFKANGPLLRIKLTTPLVFNADPAFIAIAIEVTNVGRAPTEITRIHLGSTSSTAWMNIGASRKKGPSFPLVIAPTETHRWLLDRADIKRHLLERHPGETHSLRAYVHHGDKVKRSRQSDFIADHAVRRSRTLRELLARAFVSSVTLDIPMAQDRIQDDLQRVEIANHSHGFAWSVQVDILLDRRNSGERIAIVNAPSFSYRVMRPGKKHRTLVPSKFGQRTDAGDVYWRIRWRESSGKRREQEVGFASKSEILEALALQGQAGKPTP